MDQIDSTDTSSDNAVARFLEFLSNPESARDPQAVATAERDLAESTDGISRLKALSALERANKIDGADLRAAFVKHARTWAARNQVTVSAFQTIGVPATVLVDAGFELGNGSGSDSKNKSKSGASRDRKANVSVTTVKQWASAQSGSFSLSDAMTGAGGSLMTVRKAMSDLVAIGAIRSLGQVAAPGVRGRAPERFERA